ncbi:hypothetical protein [Actinomadura macrotermitis]|uniref:Lipoprotein n=1 Tax=Actinomadura macrotermitis TaxID=2585200 RepID=A0A7K0BU09_9ACTN|nr:hypothetical protein [Actinomadura macrotermitis]MQY04678.1 hypothetical protein [Actinomadura macrotermitis]
MAPRSLRRAAPILLACALALPGAAGCGSSKEHRSAMKTSPEPIPTARLGPPVNPQRETVDLARGTTGWVGGLRLGVGQAAHDAATLVVLAGYEVPAEGNWRVSGRAGHTQRLANGYTVRIDKVVNAASTGPGRSGPGGGSVTVTVTPPK